MVLCVSHGALRVGAEPLFIFVLTTQVNVFMGISESEVTGSKSLAFRTPEFSFCAALWGLRSPPRPLLALAGSVKREGTRLLGAG